MPAQSTTSGAAYYSENDTAPLLTRQLLDGNGNPYNLEDATAVTITIAPTSWSQYYSPMAPIVDRGPASVSNASLGYVVWEPQVGDLSPPGSYSYIFEVTWNDGSIQTFPPNSYETLIIRTKPGGVA
jgi:hypothetical protein